MRLLCGPACAGVRFVASIKMSARIVCGVFAIAMTSGCASISPPERLYTVNEEIEELRPAGKTLPEDFYRRPDREQRKLRNEVVAARKYAIDLQYTKYEAALTQESQLWDFSTKAANLALAGTAQLVPVTQTKDLLNGIATGMTSLDTAYNEKILREKLLQSVQSSMRAARHERAVVIYANMRCSISTYPVAMALSDLEAYYRAGSFTGGLIKLSQTIAKEETNTATAADAQKPGDTEAQAKLSGQAEEAKMKAEAAKDKQKRNSKHKCSADDLNR